MPPPNSIDRFRHFQSAVSFIPSVIIAQEPKIARACAVFKEIFVGERFHVRLMVDARVSA